jgi:hypothetical protein
VATYTITHGQVTDGVAVVATLTGTPIQPGVSITITGNATFNGTHLVTACPEFYFLGVDEQGDYTYNPAILIPNQVAFALNVADVARTATTGALAYTPVCTWITNADAEDWLGFTVTSPSSDADLLAMAVSAANQFAWRRRQESGYTDSLTTVPGGDVKLATVMYAGYLYRQRGSIDQYASFDPLATGTAVGGSFGDILKLLGCNRPAVA